MVCISTTSIESYCKVSKATFKFCKVPLQVLSVKWYHNEEEGSQIGTPLELRDVVKRNIIDEHANESKDYKVHESHSIKSEI